MMVMMMMMIIIIITIIVEGIQLLIIMNTILFFSGTHTLPVVVSASNSEYWWGKKPREGDVHSAPELSLGTTKLHLCDGQSPTHQKSDDLGRWGWLNFWVWITGVDMTF